MKRTIFFAITLALSLAASGLFFPAAGASAATITLRERAEVIPAVVRLGDVADITGMGGAENFEDAESTKRSARAERLRSVPICSAPPPGESQILGARVIISALNSSGLDLSGLNLGGSDRVVVRRRHDLIRVEDLSRAFADHVSQNTGWPIDSFLVRPPKNLAPITIPVGETQITVETHLEEDFRGSVLAHFHVKIDGQLELTLPHRFQVERYVNALVTSRRVRRGRPLTAQDVEIAKVEQSRVGEDSFTSAEQAIGLVATRTIPEGRSLGTELLSDPPIVHKGEYKSITRSGNGFRVIIRGRLLDDGSAGDVVRVRLPSRKLVRAIVIDSKTLRVVRSED
jgi:flagella basal body P-ring formation protein FlgA